MNTNPSATRHDASDVADRRRRMLAALDIDVWQVRELPSCESLSPETFALKPPGNTSKATMQSSEASVQPAGGRSGPSAAMALLLDSEQGLKTESQQRSQSPAPEAPVKPKISAAATDERPEPSVNLWCLSGRYGVLLAEATGLSPHARRLLGDVFQAAMRIVAAQDPAADTGGKKLTQQQLRFNWPPADGGAVLGAGASTSRALRGFLSRQLQDKPDAFVLYAAPGLAQLLQKSELTVRAERILPTGDPELLLADSAAKRALWQTLNSL